MRYTGIIMCLSFQEAWRKWVVFLAFVLSVFFLLLFGFGFQFIVNHAHVNPIQRIGAYNFLLLAGLFAVHFLTTVLSIFVSADTISGEISTHTIQSMLTKPMRRWQFLLGKWLGSMSLVSLYVLILSCSVLCIVYAESGFVPPHCAEAVLLLVLQAAVLISLSILGGSLLSTHTNGVFLFLLYGIAFIGSWVEQIGAAFGSQAAVNLGIVTSFLMPNEALWRRAAYLLQPPIVGSSLFSPFSAFSVPSERMVVYAFVYGLICVILAVRCFSLRDL